MQDADENVNWHETFDHISIEEDIVATDAIDLVVERFGLNDNIQP